MASFPSSSTFRQAPSSPHVRISQLQLVEEWRSATQQPLSTTPVLHSPVVDSFNATLPSFHASFGSPMIKLPATPETPAALSTGLQTADRAADNLERLRHLMLSIPGHVSQTPIALNSIPAVPPSPSMTIQATPTRIFSLRDIRSPENMAASLLLEEGAPMQPNSNPTEKDHLDDASKDEPINDQLALLRRQFPQSAYLRPKLG